MREECDAETTFDVRCAMLLRCWKFAAGSVKVWNSKGGVCICVSFEGSENMISE